MDNKPWMIESAKDHGRKYLDELAIGIIGEIACDHRTSAVMRLVEIEQTLVAKDEVYHDLSLPWDVTNAKKAPLPEEAPKEILHPDCIVNVTKAQSFLEPWCLERILREKG